MQMILHSIFHSFEHVADLSVKQVGTAVIKRRNAFLSKVSWDQPIKRQVLAQPLMSRQLFAGRFAEAERDNDV